MPSEVRFDPRVRFHAVLRAAVTLAIVTACVGASLSAAQPARTVRFLSAGALHERLASTDQAAVEAGRHYVMGILDTLLLTKDPQVCIGPDVRLDSVVGVVKDELARNPQMHRFNAASFVREVLYTHLKCA